MKRFSSKAFAAVAFLHLTGTTWLISAAISPVLAYDGGEKSRWLTSLSWVWMPVPVLLSHHFHFGPANYFYYLALPWSVFVALCCGFIVPYLSRRKHCLV
jgi:hypothetical protein